MPTDPRGFSLLELMTALVVSAVLMAAAAPPPAALAEQQRASAMANQVLGLLHAGRLQAITRGQTVSVCPSRDGRHCGAMDLWSDGMLVQVEPRGARASPQVVRSLGAAELRGLRLVASRGRTAVAFRRDGRAAGTNQTLSLCSHDGRLLREIIVSNTGRGRVGTPAPGTRCPGPPT